MPDALTTQQFEVLRRIRDGVPFSAPPAIPAALSELLLLHKSKLVDMTAPNLVLTDLGHRYLAAAQSESGSRPPGFQASADAAPGQ